VIAAARQLGINDALPDNASIALGTGNVGLLEMTAAYAAFFNGGYLVHPNGLEAASADGRAVTLPERTLHRAIGSDDAAMMARMMAAVVRNGTGRAAAIPGRTVAGKTGTTQDSRDAWFIGWTNGDVIGIWLGNDDDRPMKGVTGGSLPAQLFHDIGLAIPRSR